MGGVDRSRSASQANVDATCRLLSFLAGLLPVLAERAPEELLDLPHAVAAGLNGQRPVLGGMFEDAAAGGLTVAPSSSHTNLLRALERLFFPRNQLLAFLDDLTILVDNNQAERDLQGLKIQ